MQRFYITFVLDIFLFSVTCFDQFVIKALDIDIELEVRYKLIQHEAMDCHLPAALSPLSPSPYLTPSITFLMIERREFGLC